MKLKFNNISSIYVYDQGLKSQFLFATTFLLVALSLISSNTVFAARLLVKDAGERNDDNNTNNTINVYGKQVKEHCAEFIPSECIPVP